MSNLSKRLEHFLNIEAESRVVYHRRAEEDKVDDSHASTTNQEAAERFTRALPLRKMDVDLIPSMPSGKFVVYRKNDNNDDAFLPKNWFVKRDNVGITILELRESVTDILPFLFANVRARLLGVDITSDANLREVRFARCGEHLIDDGNGRFKFNSSPRGYVRNRRYSPWCHKPW